MTYRGIVKEGKIELEPGVSLPEGTTVVIQPAEADSESQWADLAREVDQKWQSPKTALETLREARR